MNTNPPFAVQPEIKHTPKGIAYAYWEGKVDALPTLLVHGFHAHSRWFDELVEDMRAVTDASCEVGQGPIYAIDLSGMGDSLHREEYTYPGWGEEIAEVIGLIGGKVRLVAHSMGGRAAIFLAADKPQILERLILLDSVVVATADRIARMATSTMTRRDRLFADLDEATQSFRLLPQQPCDNKRILAHIATHSFRLKEAGNPAAGYVWKADGMLAARLKPTDPGDVIGDITLPMWLLKGELSTNCGAEDVELLRWSAPSLQDVEVVPRAFHHLFLDHPKETATQLISLLKR